MHDASHAAARSAVIGSKTAGGGLFVSDYRTSTTGVVDTNRTLPSQQLLASWVGADPDNRWRRCPLRANVHLRACLTRRHSNLITVYFERHYAPPASSTSGAYTLNTRGMSNVRVALLHSLHMVAERS